MTENALTERKRVIAANLNRAMHDKGWPAGYGRVRMLATLSGLSESAISRYLAADRVPENAAMDRLALALGKSKEELRKPDVAIADVAPDLFFQVGRVCMSMGIKTASVDDPNIRKLFTYLQTQKQRHGNLSDNDISDAIQLMGLI